MKNKLTSLSIVLLCAIVTFAVVILVANPFIVRPGASTPNYIAPVKAILTTITTSTTSSSSSSVTLSSTSVSISSTTSSLSVSSSHHPHHHSDSYDGGGNSSLSPNNSYDD